MDGGVIWRDGEMIDAADATVHVLSHGMQRGTTVFDVLRITTATDGRRMAVAMREHVTRFMRSMSLMGMETSATVAELEAAVMATAAANDNAGVIKLVAAWTEVPLTAIPVSLAPTLFVAGFDADDPDAPVAPSSSVALKTASAPKMPAALLPPSLKVAASYTIGVRERLAATSDGFHDVVFKTDHGDLAEGTTQAIFVVRDGRLIVPPLDSVLDGITRRLVIDVAHHVGIVVEVRPVAWSEVETADELFQCSTNYPVRPVHRHDERALPSAGPVVGKLAGEVNALYADDHPLSVRWLTPIS